MADIDEVGDSGKEEQTSNSEMSMREKNIIRRYNLQAVNLQYFWSTVSRGNNGLLMTVPMF